MRTLSVLTALALLSSALGAHLLVVSDQDVRGTTITIDSVIADADGFVVVHATDANGDLVLTPPLGVAYVAAGTHTDLAIDLDPTELAKYAYHQGGAIVPMLHVDADGDRAYSFPNGPDVPVMVDGAMVVTTVDLVLRPGIWVNDQVAAAGAVTIDTVVAEQDGFVVVHALDADGAMVLTPPLGVAPVSAGVSRFVSVALDASVLETYGYGDAAKAIVPMLHVDADGDGTYAFPDGPDVPVSDADGAIVAPLELGVAAAGMAMIDVGDGTLELGADGLAVTLASVTLTQPGFVALHGAEADGSLRVLPILGVSGYLTAGTHMDVTIPFAADQVATIGDMAFAMAHVDDGDGTYTFPMSDAPFFQAGAMFVEPLTLR
jgi:hypothetical protein